MPSSRQPHSPPIFVVGKGRSGNTLVGRVLKRHPDVALLPELHFFGRVWSRRSGEARLSRDAAVELVTDLFRRARVYPRHLDREPLRADAVSLVSEFSDDELTPPAVFRTVLVHEAGRQGKRIPCEQTPRNVFFLREILAVFPDARVVVVVRDPRGVFASQKDKWKVTAYGPHPVRAAERRRWRVNSHPVAIALQWRAAVRAGERFADDERVFVLRFEDLVERAVPTVHELCRFLGLDVDEAMLDVPHIGPNFERTGRRGLDPSEAGRWREQLGPTEIFLCERIAGRAMRRLGYEPVGARPEPLALARAVVALPLQAAAMVALNRPQYAQLTARLRR
jgi:hypothetical protein